MNDNNQNTSQVTSDNTGSTDSSNVIAEMQNDILDTFPEIESITLSRLDSEKEIYYASVLLKKRESTARRNEIATRLMTRFVDRYHALLLPVFFDPKKRHEDRLESSCQQLFDPLSDREIIARRFNRLKESSDYPVSIRRWCLDTIDRYTTSVDSVLSADAIPYEIALTAFLEMMQNVLSLLFASKGGVFTHDSDAIVFFRDQFATADSSLRESDLVLFYQLLALKQQNLYSESDSNKYHRRQFEKLLHLLADFFKRSRRYIKTAYTTEMEQRRRRRFSIGLALGGVFISIITVAAYFAISFLTFTNSVQIDEKKSGGIAGEYYKGKDFNERVLGRVDKQIDFSTKGKLDSRLPKDQFSARWKGYIKTDDSGKQKICFDHDDGCRFYFHGKLAIDEWKRSSKKRSCATINAEKGWHPIKIEYFDRKGEAILRLLRGSNKDEAKRVASRDLCCLK